MEIQLIKLKLIKKIVILINFVDNSARVKH